LISDIRDQTCFLLSHFNLLCSESLRIVELPDLFSILLENEGISECHAVVMVLNQGKTNQFGKLEFTGCIRSKEVEICPVGSLALYLFARFQLGNEPFPDFRKNETWYNIKLCQGRLDVTKSILYDTQLYAINQCFKALGIKSSRKTHIGRGSGAIMAELAGAPNNSTRWLGRWNQKAIENCYMSTLPREAMRALAGFNPKKPQYYLRRATITPNDQLQHQIFPAVDLWLEKLQKSEIESNIAAGGFLNLLKYLRVVVLQDSALLQIQHPETPLFKHSIFKSDEFKRFQTDLLAVEQDRVDPFQVQLESIVPTLAHCLDTFSQYMKDGFKLLETIIESQAQSVNKKFTDICEGRATIRLTLSFLKTQ
jgi:hypothetical protein